MAYRVRVSRGTMLMTNAARRGVGVWLLLVGLRAPAEAAQAQLDCRPDDAGYVVDSWSTDEGLPQSTVTSIAQTRDGFLWIGTLGGLARFDGDRFRVFTGRDGLPSQRVLALLVATDGAMWIGTEGSGVARYADGVFTAFSTAHGLSHPVVQQIVEDRSGRVWFGTRSGLNVWEGERFTALGTVEGVPDGAMITGLTGGAAGDVWVSTERHLCRMEGTSPRCTPLDADVRLNHLMQRRPDELWMGTDLRGVIRRIGERSEAIRTCDGPTCLPGTEVWAMTAARTADVWIATNRGLSRWRDGRVSHYSTATGLPSDRVRSVFEDREGSIWAGTSDAGLIRLKPRRFTVCGTPHGLAPEVVTTVAEDRDGTLWIGSNCGGLRTLRAGRVARFVSVPADLTRCVFSVEPASDGGSWFGTWGNGLLKQTGRSLRRYTTADGLSDSTVLAIHEDATGGVWVGTYDGGLDYLRDGRFTRFTVSDGLAGTYQTSIAEQADGTIWAGSNRGGLTRVVNGRLTAIRSKDGLGSNTVRALLVDRRDTLWIGTGDAGLVRFSNGAFVRYDSTRGLIDDNVAQIVEDARGDIWIGSGHGISRLRRTELDAVADGRLTSLNVLTLGKGDGLARAEAVGDHSPGGWRARDGRLWFATYGGLVVVDPERIRVNEMPPPIAIESVVIDGVPVQPSALVRARAGARSLQIRYTALSLVDPQRNRFRYRLADWDRDWVEAGTDRTAEYGGIPPGRYEFTVLGANSDGVWSTTGARMLLEFEPYLWQQWWFQPALVLASVLALALSFRVAASAKIRREVEAFERESAVDRERARIARDMHDELGARLTNVAMLADSSAEEPRLRQVSEALRQAVQAMDQTVWAINPRNDSLENFASYVSKYAHEFLGAASIHCRLDVPISLPRVVLAAKDRHALLMVVKEALTNIVRHAQATEAWFRLRVDDRARLVIEVSDNGGGLVPTEAGRHRHGLANMRERMAGLGGTLDLQSGASGTTVTLVLPGLGGHTNR